MLGTTGGTNDNVCATCVASVRRKLHPLFNLSPSWGFLLRAHTNMKGVYPTYRKRRAPTCKNLLPVRLCVMRLALKNISFYDIHNTLIFTYRTKYRKIGCFRIWPNFCPGLVAAYSAAYPSILYHSSPLQHTAILSCFSPIHSPHVSHLYNYFLLISVIIFFSHSDIAALLLWL